MNNRLLKMLRIGAALLLPLAWSAATHAQTYPNRPIRILHGFAAGGNADSIARLVATDLATGLGQPVIVEAKAGAGGTIAATTVAASKPDGYSLLLATGGHAIAGVLYDKLPYDTAQSFQPISALTSFPFLVVVNAASPYTQLSDLLTAATAKPRTLTFGTAGVGTGQHMTGELLANRASVSLVHVPYRGESASVSALLGSEVDFIVVAPTAALQHVKAGKLRALATSGATRWSGLPDVKTVAEQGVAQFEVRSWTALLAPAGTPQAIVDRLTKQVNTALQDPTLRNKLAEITGGEVHASSGKEVQTTIESDLKRWAQLVKAANIQKN